MSSNHFYFIPSIYHHFNVIQSFLVHSVIILSFQCHSIISSSFRHSWLISVIPVSFNHSYFILSLYHHSGVIPLSFDAILMPFHISNAILSLLSHFSHFSVIQVILKPFHHANIIPHHFDLIPWGLIGLCHKVWRKIVHPKVRLGDVTGMTKDWLFPPFNGHSESEWSPNGEMRTGWQGWKSPFPGTFPSEWPRSDPFCHSDVISSF